MRKEEEKIEGYLKAIQNVGEMIGEVLKEDEDKERCKFKAFSLASSGAEAYPSPRKNLQWTTLYCGIRSEARQGKAKGRH